MAACGVLLLGGGVGVARWGGLAVEAPWGGDGPAGDSPPPPATVLRRYLWYLDLAVISGLVAGLAAVGPGGRLAMRLLAVTAGDGAQGRLTEAEETVGAITAGGTIGFIVFAGVFGGLVVGALYAVVRRCLPAGRLGGVLFGLLLLVVGGTRIEPLRAGNPDFGLVGPGWLAVLAFSAVVVFAGMLVAAAAGWWSRRVPELSRRPSTWLPYAPLVVPLLAGPLALGLVVLGAVAVGAGPRGRLVAWARSAALTAAGRVVLCAVAAAALPGFVAAVAEITGRAVGSA